MFTIILSVNRNCWSCFASTTFDVSFLSQLRLEKLKFSAPYEQNLSAGTSICQIQVFNLQVLILAGITSSFVPGTSKYIDVCIQDISFYYLKKQLQLPTMKTSTYCEYGLVLIKSLHLPLVVLLPSLKLSSHH